MAVRVGSKEGGHRGSEADVPRVELSEEVGERIRRGFAKLPTLEEDLEGLLAGLLQTACELPRDAIRAILRFRADPNVPGALVITGMPIDDDLPPTPSDPVPASVDPAPVGGCSILLVSVLLGEPVAYAAEKDGVVVQHIFATRAQQTTPSNESSAVRLEFHTELTFSRQVPAQSFDVAAPDFVLLLALRSLPGRSATTSIVEARDLCELLEPGHLEALRQPWFELQAPYSFTRDSDEPRPWSPPLALVGGSRGSPSIVFDIACGVRAVSHEANEALEGLRRACSESIIHRRIELRPGELIAIDNHKCAHARSQFDARFDGRDRWLRRTYVRRSIRALQSDPERSFRVLA